MITSTQKVVDVPALPGMLTAFHAVDMWGGREAWQLGIALDVDLDGLVLSVAVNGAHIWLRGVERFVVSPENLTATPETIVAALGRRTWDTPAMIRASLRPYVADNAETRAAFAADAFQSERTGGPRG